VARTLGIDIGTVRVGVALSDPLRITAQPLVVINRKRGDIYSQLVAVVDDNEVDRIVVGYPLQLDGRVGLAAQAADEFIANLEQRVSVPIDRWDERLSTKAAERSMIEAGARRERRRENIDKVAAALILQSYLDAKSHGP
jgi:putative Holliday junction resolvase